MKAKAPGTENLQVNGADIASVTSTIAKLQQDPSIDCVVTLGAPIAMAAPVDSEAGSTAKVVTFDLNADVAKLKAGKIEFSVDQQPYLQGYDGCRSLWLYQTNGNVFGGGLPVLTGPSFVDRSNIDVVCRIRGQQHSLCPCPGGAQLAPPGHPPSRENVMSQSLSKTPATPPASPRVPRAGEGPVVVHDEALARPEIGAFIAAVVIYIFFFIVAPPFR